MNKLACLFFAAIFSSSVLSEELKQMPEWQLFNAKGTLIKSSDLLGKPLILHFWATWCPYCKKVQPGLDTAYKIYQDRGLQLIGISFREDEGVKPQTVLDKRGLSFQTLIEGDYVAKTLFGVKGTPTTFYINAKGEIVKRSNSSNPNDPEIEETIALLLMDAKS